MSQLSLRVIVAAIVQLLVVDASFAQFVHDGPDVLVSGQEALNEDLSYSQQSVAKDSADRFVVAWSVLGASNDSDVYARRFDADGTPLGSQFVVNSVTADSQSGPSVAMAADGRFAVAWTRLQVIEPGLVSGPAEIGARVFDAAGNAVTGDIAVNTFTAGNQATPTMGMASDGSFVVLWTSTPHEQSDPAQDGSVGGVFARRYDANGVPQGAELAVNAYTTGDQQASSIAVRPDGSFVAVWDGEGADSTATMFGRAFDSAGAAIGPDFAINSGSYHGYAPRVAVDTDGSFMVAWETRNDADGDGFAVLARRFDASGAPLTPPFVLNGFTPGWQHASVVAAHGDGTFSAAWIDSEQYRPGSERTVVRRFAANGTPLGSETHADYGTVAGRPALLARADGSVVVVSEGRKRPPAKTPYLVLMQRLCDPASGCVPDEGCAEVIGDSRIKLRNVGLDANPTDDALSVKGDFSLPHGTVLADLERGFSNGVDGLRVVIAADDGTIRSDDLLTALTTSLRSRGDGSILVFKEDTATVNGIRSAVLKLRRGLSDLAPDRVQFKLKAKGGSFPVVPGDEPLRVTVELAGQPTCGPETFTPAQCTFYSGQTTVDCK